MNRSTGPHDVVCVRCGAKQGQPCMGMSGRVHAVRSRAFEAAFALVGLVPLRPTPEIGAALAALLTGTWQRPAPEGGAR